MSGPSSHWRRAAEAVLDCGCVVRLSKPQVIVYSKGRRIRVGCHAHRRTSHVKRLA